MSNAHTVHLAQMVLSGLAGFFLACCAVGSHNSRERFFFGMCATSLLGSVVTMGLS